MPCSLASVIISRRSDQDILARFLDVPANLGADFDDRLVHLGLDRLMQRQLGLGKNLRRHVRAQIASLRIDGLVFLFDSDAEARPIHGHPLVARLTYRFGCSWLLGRRAVHRRMRRSPLRKALQRYSANFPVCCLGFAHCQFGHRVHDPVEIFLADGIHVRVGRGIHEVDGVRNAVFAGKLDGVQVVAQSAAEREAIALHSLQQLGIDRRRILHVALVERAPTDRSA